MNDNHIIVYRSRGEQMVDDFWWSEGSFTATRAGDAIFFSFVALVAVIVFAWVYKKIF